MAQLQFANVSTSAPEADGHSTSLMTNEPGNIPSSPPSSPQRVDIEGMVWGILGSVGKGVGKIISNPVNPISVVSSVNEMVVGILNSVGTGLAIIPPISPAESASPSSSRRHSADAFSQSSPPTADLSLSQSIPRSNTTLSDILEVEEEKIEENVDINFYENDNEPLDLD